MLIVKLDSVGSNSQTHIFEAFYGHRYTVAEFDVLLFDLFMNTFSWKVCESVFSS